MFSCLFSPVWSHFSPFMRVFVTKLAILRYCLLLNCCNSCRILCAQCMYACLCLCLFYSMDAYIFLVVGYTVPDICYLTEHMLYPKHEPDLYPASKSSKAILTLDIGKGRIYSSRAQSAVYRGLPLYLFASPLFLYILGSWFFCLEWCVVV